nr:unnamed protein product [Callosobruchus analis]
MAYVYLYNYLRKSPMSEHLYCTDDVKLFIWDKMSPMIENTKPRVKLSITLQENEGLRTCGGDKDDILYTSPGLQNSQ